MSIFELWLFVTAIPGLSWAAGVLLMCTMVSAGITYFVCLVSEFDEKVVEFAVKHTPKYIGLSVIFLILTAILPSEKQMLLIAGGYTAINNKEISEMPSSAAKAVNAWLNAIADAAKDKDEGKKEAK